jgi:hypothetical protein
MPGKKFAQPLRQRKKIVQANNKVQIVLKTILADVKCIKKILQRHETEKKIVPQKFYTHPPGISNGPPLISIFNQVVPLTL